MPFPHLGAMRSKEKIMLGVFISKPNKKTRQGRAKELIKRVTEN